MILRIWHGYTTPENADAYEALLKQEVFHGIESRGLSGFEGIELLRGKSAEGEIEFVTILRFAKIGDVKSFMGDDYEAAYVPDEARKLLKRFDARARHYDLRDERNYLKPEGVDQLATAIGSEADA